jgi:hypothetical protein
MVCAPRTVVNFTKPRNAHETHLSCPRSSGLSVRYVTADQLQGQAEYQNTDGGKCFEEAELNHLQTCFRVTAVPS